MPQPLRLAAHAARALAATAVLIVAIGAALGWLYLIRANHALAAGPSLREALPLQRLAGQDRQPLLRVLVAWVPAGLLAAAGLAALTRMGRGARAAVAGLVCFALLFALGAESDVVTASDPLGPHVAPQLERPATWLAAAIFAACALIPRSRAAWRDAWPATDADARRSGGSVPWAA